MTIQTGTAIPDVTLKVMGEKGPENISTRELLGNGKVVLFGVPGAFTPTCSVSHLPGYVVHGDAIKAKGVSRIVCMSVNDVFVMNAWGKANNAEDLVMLADGNAEFTRALGLEMDASGFGMGTRCKRFAMIIENGAVQKLLVEEPGKFEVSKAEYVLEQL